MPSSSAITRTAPAEAPNLAREAADRALDAASPRRRDRLVCISGTGEVQAAAQTVRVAAPARLMCAEPRKVGAEHP